MGVTDKVVLAHHGALGDFLCAYGVFAAARRHFPGIPICFSGPASRLPWLAPLGAVACPPELTRSLDGLYGRPDWPAELARTVVIRPGLAVRPEAPESPNFLFLPGIAPGRFAPPEVLYREALASRGMAWDEAWRGDFARAFGPLEPDGQTVLLFPGAGHVFKAWPTERYVELAVMLAGRGLRPVFVLGPFEVERGVEVGRWPVIRPKDALALGAALRAATAVIGNDSGPMHLAGLLGLPGVVLFGPTSPEQWGPPGLGALRGSCPRAPCAQVTAGAFPGPCPAPSCLEGISTQRVLEAFLAVLERPRPRKGLPG